MSRRKDGDNSASRFNHRVTLQRPVITQDSLGDKIITWVNEGEYWADIRPISGKEDRLHEGRRAIVTHQVFLRYRADIKENWRISYEGRYMQIHAVLNVGEEKFVLKLRVEELN